MLLFGMPLFLSIIPTAPMKCASITRLYAALPVVHIGISVVYIISISVEISV
jgi:hypothetical protein